jgi:hypothetical protein
LNPAFSQSKSFKLGGEARPAGDPPRFPISQRTAPQAQEQNPPQPAPRQAEDAEFKPPVKVAGGRCESLVEVLGGAEQAATGSVTRGSIWGWGWGRRNRWAYTAPRACPSLFSVIPVHMFSVCTVSALISEASFSGPIGPCHRVSRCQDPRHHIPKQRRRAPAAARAGSRPTPCMPSLSPADPRRRVFSVPGNLLFRPSRRPSRPRRLGRIIDGTAALVGGMYWSEASLYH